MDLDSPGFVLKEELFFMEERKEKVERKKSYSKELKERPQPSLDSPERVRDGCKSPLQALSFPAPAPCL